MKTTILSLSVLHLAAMCFSAEVQYDASVSQLSFAAAQLEEALEAENQTKQDVIVRLEIGTDDRLKPEGFSVRKNGNTITVTGPDAAGAMYGGLDVAETIRVEGFAAVDEKVGNPCMELRGIKFNIPLDVRTPSYSDLGDAGQYNMPHIWDFDFWKATIDEIAGHRYNYISLWSLHPFPSLVKVPDYPDIALADVKRAVGLERKFYHGRGEHFDAPKILDETETLITMTMDEKIAFWRKVMRYGKSRNVDFYIVTWNIFDYGAEGKYGIDDSIDNPTTADYFRKSVTQLFLTYPDLKGIGITTGENMHDASNQEKEDWMLSTYGLGVLDVLKEQPKRKITFLHRQHQAGAGAIADTFKPLIDHPNVDFIFSYKYAKAHAYSAVRQPFYRSFAKEIEGRTDDLKTIWTMRNDSTYLFRWAAPDFLRAFIQNIPMELTRGYYFGSDGMIWGREFIRKDVDGPRQLELQKHWFQWLLWGRLAYDPDLSDERLTGIIQARFPEVDATRLLKRWQAASMVFPLATGFHWGPLDYHWYPEACVGFPNYAKTDTGFHDVNRFITLGTHPGSGYASIPKYVETVMDGKPFKGTGPLQVSEKLLSNADLALETSGRVDAGTNAELAETLKDIEAMAHLGRYYGYKIKGATYLHLYREAGNPDDRSRSIENLQHAAQAWRLYAKNVSDRFKLPMWLCRVRIDPLDFEQITEWVDNDIRIAEQ